MAILAVPFPVYQHAMRVISSISNSNLALIVTTIDHQYITGLIVRLNIPLGFGMTQANQLYAPIIVIDSTTFSIDIDTTDFDAFSAPGVYPLNYQYAQVTPIGEINSTLLGATRNVLPY